METTTDTESPKDRGKIFLRVEPALKERWVKTCREQNIDQNRAGEEMVRWVLSLDAETRAMIFGQIPRRADLVQVLLKRLGGIKGTAENGTKVQFVEAKRSRRGRQDQ